MQNSALRFFLMWYMSRRSWVQSPVWSLFCILTGRSNKKTPANDLGLRVSEFHFGKIQFNCIIYATEIQGCWFRRLHRKKQSSGWVSHCVVRFWGLVGG